MGEWTFRVFGELLELDADDRCDLLAEMTRLHRLMRDDPDSRLARLNANPSGLVGEYARLLIEATVRGHPAEDVVPANVRRCYASRHWFAVSLEVLAGFSEQWASVRAERSRQEPPRRRQPDYTWWRRR